MCANRAVYTPHPRGKPEFGRGAHMSPPGIGVGGDWGVFMCILLGVCTFAGLLFYFILSIGPSFEPCPSRLDVGDTVHMKLDDREAMILGIYPANAKRDVVESLGCQYRVRVSSLSARIPDHLLGSGGEVSHAPYRIIRVYGFEIKEAYEPSR